MKKLLPLLLFFPLAALAQNQNIGSEQQAKAMAAQQENPALMQSPQNVLVCEPVDAPYNENFESAVVPGMPECSTLQNAGTGNNFTTISSPGYGFTSKTLNYRWNTSSAANAWYFTRGINMTAGTAYNISYRYGSAGSTAFTEKLKVHIGTAATVAGMDAAPLIDHPLVNNNVTPITDNLQFTPGTTGVYYIGFNCYSNPDQFYLFVDDIAVSTNLAASEFDIAGLSYFPNPVKDIAFFQAENNIDSVTLINMLGQKVLTVKAASRQVEVDLGSLPKGNFLAEIVSGNKKKTINLIKE